MSQKRQYDCYVKEIVWERTYFATSPGKAKVQAWHDLREVIPDLPYTVIRCQVWPRQAKPTALAARLSGDAA
jgi:hypothetical protein